jgi:hypothetical protein
VPGIGFIVLFGGKGTNLLADAFARPGSNDSKMKRRYQSLPCRRIHVYARICLEVGRGDVSLVPPAGTAEIVRLFDTLMVYCESYKGLDLRQSLRSKVF